MKVGIASATQDRHDGASKIKRYEAIVDFTLDYGLPGKPGYTYDRPFDYFSVQAAASTAIGFDSLATRGLLLGRRYDIGDEYRSIWGLYGSYNYIAPQIFRLASTALSLGTTGEWRVSEMLTLQATALVGVGYATVSTINRIAHLKQPYPQGHEVSDVRLPPLLSWLRDAKKSLLTFTQTH